MSGGVDSSVAAYLIAQGGYSAMGATLKLFDNAVIGLDNSKSCCSLEDVEDARQVCKTLGIPHYVFNASRRFGEDVIDRFIREYAEGRTPNPCIDCNRFIKFDALLQKMHELDFEYVTTGHYARRCFDEKTGRYLLKTGQDKTKDQSYTLYHLTQNQLAHLLLPLGDLSKARVRDLAQLAGFENARKPDSQDICFVPDGNYASFIESREGKTFPPGPFIDSSGVHRGTHGGIIRYTVGQRKGLGISSSKPLYVCKKDIHTNSIVVGPESELFTESLVAHDINLISVSSLESPLRVRTKTHYRHTASWATAVQTDADELHLVFDEPQRAVSPGQSVVLYEGDTVVGGGVISEGIKAHSTA